MARTGKEHDREKIDPMPDWEPRREPRPVKEPAREPAAPKRKERETVPAR